MTGLLRPCRLAFVAVASLLLIALAPREAGAQLVATSFEGLQPLVKPGDTLEVTDASGRRTRARLGELSPSSLELLVRRRGPDGRETFVPHARLSERDVTQIRLEHRDSIWNGTLLGAAIGAGPWLVVGALAAASGGGSCGSDSNVCPYVALFTGPIGTGIGAWIDASIRRRTTVYNRATAFGDLPRLIEIGDTIYVTNAAGATIRGTVAGLSDSVLELQVLRENAIPLTLLARDVNNITIDRIDPLWNGMLIGFAAGSVPVALLGVGCVCPAGEIAAASGGYGALGLLTGLLIDALNKERETIYVQGQRSAGIRVTPLLSTSAAGVQVWMRF